jgi:hypothetical protein
MKAVQMIEAAITSTVAPRGIRQAVFGVIGRSWVVGCGV